MSTTNSTGSAQFDSIGLKRGVNGRSCVTMRGGGRMAREGQQAMVDGERLVIHVRE